jgi:hypothetical protein
MLFAEKLTLSSTNTGKDDIYLLGTETPIFYNICMIHKVKIMCAA